MGEVFCKIWFNYQMSLPKGGTLQDIGNLSVGNKGKKNMFHMVYCVYKRVFLSLVGII